VNEYDDPGAKEARVLSLGGRVPQPLDWHRLLSGEPDPEKRFLVEPLVPAGRHMAIYGPPKVGKSLLGLDLAAAVAAGRGILGRAAGAPTTVLYFDAEMSEEDVAERTWDMGYTPDELSSLRYFSVPDMEPLDRPAGGTMMAELLDAFGPDLVVLDSVASLTVGAENDADTIRAYWRHTGTVLKRYGATVFRLDLSGADTNPRRPRGSTHKVGDVDAAFAVSVKGENDLVLRRTHSRMPWVPAGVALRRQSDPLRHVLVDPERDRVAEIARLLDSLDVALDASKRDATEALQTIGRGCRPQVVLAALELRRER
jgi:KaiC/GvpD/RAD55 family RecA-like ATPase